MTNEKKLFDTLVGYYISEVRLKESIKDTLDSEKEAEKITKEDIAAINKAAKLYVADKYQETKDAFDRVVDKYELLSGED